MFFKTSFELSCEFFGNREEGRIFEDRIPDLSYELKPLGDRQLADVRDVSHHVILRSP